MRLVEFTNNCQIAELTFFSQTACPQRVLSVSQKEVELLDNRRRGIGDYWVESEQRRACMITESNYAFAQKGCCGDTDPFKIKKGGLGLGGGAGGRHQFAEEQAPGLYAAQHLVSPREL